MNYGFTFEPADLIWFSGKGWKSRVIELFTCSIGQLIRGELISHIGGCVCYNDSISLFESTSLSNLPCIIQKKCVKGTQAHLVEERIKEYDGAVWVSKLDPEEKLTIEESQKLTRLAIQGIGIEYDLLGALIAGTHFIKRISWIKPDTAELFCDEWWADMLMKLHKLPRTFNVSTITPAWLAWHVIHIGLYKPLIRLK